MTGDPRFEWNPDPVGPPADAPNPMSGPLAPYPETNAQSWQSFPAGQGAAPAPVQGSDVPFGQSFGQPPAPPAAQPHAGFAPNGAIAPHRSAPTGMSTGAKVLIGLAIGAVGLVILGIVAAVAIPVFLNQRSATAGLPDQLHGLPKSEGEVFEDIANQARASLPQNMQADTSIAYYGAGTSPELMVMRVGNIGPTDAVRQAVVASVGETSGLKGMSQQVAAGADAARCGLSIYYSGCVTVDSKYVVITMQLTTTPSETQYPRLLATHQLVT